MSFRSLAQHWPSVGASEPFHDVRSLAAGAVGHSDVVRLQCEGELSPEVISLIVGLPNLRDLYLINVRNYPADLCKLGRLETLTIDQSPSFVGLPKEAIGLRGLRVLRVNGALCHPK
jgi:hypothetical protein